MFPSVRTLCLLCLLLTGCGGSSGGASAAPPTPPAAAVPFEAEIIVRTAENFQRAEDVAALVDSAARNKVKVISLLVKQDEDAQIPSGQVFYRSDIAPRAAGYEQFDVLQTLLDAAHARSIRVRAWIPQFHDQVAAKAHPQWQMQSLRDGKVQPYMGARQTEYFVNPLSAEVQAYELSIIDEIVKKYPVDGVMLDWIRFDNYNMDLGDATRADYQARYGIDPVTLDFSKPSAALDQWNAYRTDGLAAYVRAVRAKLPPAMELGVYILPPEFVEVGQDAAKFNTQVNTLAPMCYFVDWGYPMSWLWSSCLASTVAKAGAAGITPAMDSHLTDDQYRSIFSHLRTDFPQIRTLAWFWHERWTDAMLQRIALLSAQ